MKAFSCILLLLLLTATGATAAEFAAGPSAVSTSGPDPGFQRFLTEAGAASQVDLGLATDTHGRQNLATSCSQITNLCARINCECSEQCSGSVATFPCVLNPRPRFDLCRCA